MAPCKPVNAVLVTMQITAKKPESAVRRILRRILQRRRRKYTHVSVCVSVLRVRVFYIVLE